VCTLSAATRHFFPRAAADVALADAAALADVALADVALADAAALADVALADAALADAALADAALADAASNELAAAAQGLRSSVKWPTRRARPSAPTARRQSSGSSLRQPIRARICCR